jgi:hypothetical protein
VHAYPSRNDTSTLHTNTHTHTHTHTHTVWVIDGLDQIVGVDEWQFLGRVYEGLLVIATCDAGRHDVVKAIDALPTSHLVCVCVRARARARINMWLRVCESVRRKGTRRIQT